MTEARAGSPAILESRLEVEGASGAVDGIRFRERVRETALKGLRRFGVMGRACSFSARRGLIPRGRPLQLFPAVKGVGMRHEVPGPISLG